LLDTFRIKGERGLCLKSTYSSSGRHVDDPLECVAVLSLPCPRLTPFVFYFALFFFPFPLLADGISMPSRARLHPNTVGVQHEALIRETPIPMVSPCPLTSLEMSGWQPAERSTTISRIFLHSSAAPVQVRQLSLNNPAEIISKFRAFCGVDIL